MGWAKPTLSGAAAGALTGLASMTAWYFLFPPGAPEQYFVAFGDPDDRYATLDVDRGVVVKIVVFFCILGAAVAFGLATVRQRLPQRRRRLFDAASIVGLCTLAGATITAVVYQVGHQFASSQSSGHWPSAHYDYLVPLMPAFGFLIGLIGAAIHLRLHPRDQ